MIISSSIDTNLWVLDTPILLTIISVDLVILHVASFTDIHSFAGLLHGSKQ